ncbi:L-fucose:H+ symporter permease [Sphingomonas sp. LB-2]|uniref:L-fucose:H+ symporter permease n=1 Tax=Sphingomonas caeni TaxID=2984949 RepID=UPI002230C300|nr:L-fucose:H+ symporter permease [Sphingomonas caeni]MCW3848875.1 L-fucose:H+ symporter permease [Sphingomonas caeni]
MTDKAKRYLLPLILIVSLFFLWGAANNLNDVLMKHFKKAFILDDFQTGLIQSAFYFGYFCFAIPAALFMKRFGYKAAVVLGLALFGAGALLFLPAADSRSYAFFLLALYVLASGLAFLETSANPLVTVLGDPSGAEQRLNFAQSFNPLGSITGVLIGSNFILSGVEYTPEQTAAMSDSALQAYYAAETAAVKGPYLVIGLFVLVWAALVAFVKFPPAAAKVEDEVASKGDYGALFGKPLFLLGVVAQFFYVGAQVGVWSFLIRYTQAELPGTGEKWAAQAITISLVLLFVGRFLGAAAMSRIAPAKLLAGFAAINVLLCIVGALVGGSTGLAALIATSLFMSIMFPTIFALSLRGLGPLTKAGSSLLVMSIIGGAVLTAVMGYISDKSSIALAMLVPALAFVAVFAFARSAGKAAA